MVHYRGGRAAIDPQIHPDQEQFWADLSTAYAAQIRAVAELGYTYLQLDDTSLAYLDDPTQRRMIDERGDDGDQRARAVHPADERRPGRQARGDERDPPHVPW